ncbi:MAG: FISUMP domain-containing protein [Paludibacter sp.]
MGQRWGMQENKEKDCNMYRFLYFWDELNKYGTNDTRFMKQRIFKYSAILITLIFISFSCGEDFNIYVNPPSPINIPNAITFNPNLKYDTITDIDGNIYKTITIGKHTWMAENLRVTRFRNGDKIPFIPRQKDWANEDMWAGDGNLGFCVYNNNNDKDSIARYGFLYGVLAIEDARSIAPLGWHISTEKEWYDLTGDSTLTFLGAQWASSIITKKTPINNSGLTLLPAGIRFSDGNFGDRGKLLRVYSGASSFFTFEADIFQHINGQLWRFSNGGHEGYSIRCVKDE